jgi:D-alanine-D-alanine ligase
MHVALVYNLKKDACETEDTIAGPSSQNITDVSTQVKSVRKSADTYAEWDTQETITAVCDALALHHSVTLIEGDEDAFEKIRTGRPDIVFNIAEGRYGASREAQVPAMLEMLNIPYSGSDPLTLAICLDKSRAKEILSHYSIPTPKFFVIHSMDDVASVHTEFPCIVKPLFEGSSKGIFNSSLAYSAEELSVQAEKIINLYQQPALVEKFLPGREFTVALLGNGKDLEVLPIVEIKFDSLPNGVNPIYSFEAKWIWDEETDPLDIFDCPANLTPDLRISIENVCKRAFNVLRCRDWCRIDVRLDEKGIPNIIELNPLPGILPNPEQNSCFPKAARAAGYSYNEMLNRVLDAACKRNGLTS